MRAVEPIELEQVTRGCSMRQFDAARLLVTPEKESRQIGVGAYVHTDFGAIYRATIRLRR